MTSIESEIRAQQPQQDLTHQARTPTGHFAFERVPVVPSGGDQPPLSAWSLTSTQRHWALWIHGLANWSVMVTLTFKRKDGRGQITTRQSVISALRHLIRLINFRCFGPRRVRQGWTVGVAPVVVADADSGHLHAHVLLTTPKGYTERWYRSTIERAARRTRLVDRQRCISNYRDSGGAAYVVKHGVIRMDPSLIVLPHPK